MKVLLLVLGFLNATYMFVDGVFVMMNGKFIGPDKPGPWSLLFEKLNIDVFKLGPLFILFGVAWFIFLFGLYSSQSWVYLFGIILSIATLWYLPIGTLISIITIIILLSYKQKLNL